MLCTRRRALLGGLLAVPLATPRAAPMRTDHGDTQDWFHEGFLNLPEDLHEATAAGQRLAVVFEQRGCPYCLEMHTDHLVQPGIEAFIRPRFRIVQLDLHCARPVTDFDGEAVEERQLARRWRVTFTPTVVFLPDAAPERPRPGREIEVARMPGLLPKPQFLGLFTYVAERAYADGTAFPSWWARRNAGQGSTGQPNLPSPGQRSSIQPPISWKEPVSTSTPVATSRPPAASSTPR